MKTGMEKYSQVLPCMALKAETLEKMISLLILFVCPVWRLGFSSGNKDSGGTNSIVSSD